MKWPKASFNNRLAFFAVAILFTSCSAGAAEGLSTAFADVTVRGVAPGVPYKVIGSGKKSLVIRNLGEKALRVQVDVLPPDPQALRRGASAIPEVGWIQVRPAVLDLPAHSEKEYEVFVTIPDQQQYRKKLYQVMLWSHGIPTESEGVTVSAGLLSRLQFESSQ